MGSACDRYPGDSRLCTVPDDPYGNVTACHREPNDGHHAGASIYRPGAAYADAKHRHPRPGHFNPDGGSYRLTVADPFTRATVDPSTDVHR